jgi:hypothetical protein
MKKRNEVKVGRGDIDLGHVTIINLAHPQPPEKEKETSLTKWTRRISLVVAFAAFAAFLFTLTYGICTGDYSLLHDVAESTAKFFKAGADIAIKVAADIVGGKK